MTNSKLTRRALFTSVMALVLCFAMLTGTTFAWFTDQETSGNNKIIAGNLDVELTHTNKNVTDVAVDGETKLFQAVSPEKWEPGAMAVETFTVTNAGNLALKYEFSMNVVGATLGKDGQTSFAEMLKVAVVDGTVDLTSRIDPTNFTWDSFKNFTKPGNLYPAGYNTDTTTYPQTSQYTVIVWWEPSDLDNNFNMNNGKTDKMTADFNIQLVATQLMAEEDAFDNKYDEDSQFTSTGSATVPDGKLDADNKLTEALVITSADQTAKATLAAGTKLATGVTEITLTTTPTTPQNNDGAVYAEAYAIDISVEGLADDNTELVTVTKNAALPTGLTNPVAYHKGTKMDSANFSYDPATGDITVKVSKFCNFTFAFKELTKVSDGLYRDANANYYVYNANGLATINSMMKDKTTGKDTVVNIMADIDFTGKAWTPVDSHADTAFTLKEINGNGHTISNLTINGQAMFNRFAGSGDVVIKDITFDNATVNSTAINSSILTVQSYQNVLLDNVDVKNSTINGGYKVAPLIATVYNESNTTVTATLKNCDVSNTTVKATSYDFCTTGMVAFVYADDNDKIEFENCTVTDVKLIAPDDGYKAHAAVYTTGSESLYNEVEGVTVTNVTFEALK